MQCSQTFILHAPLPCRSLGRHRGDTAPPPTAPSACSSSRRCRRPLPRWRRARLPKVARGDRLLRRWRRWPGRRDWDDDGELAGARKPGRRPREAVVLSLVGGEAPVVGRGRVVRGTTDRARPDLVLASRRRRSVAGLCCASAAGEGSATTVAGVAAWKLPGAARRGAHSLVNLARSFGQRKLPQVLGLVDDGDGAHDGVLWLPCQ